MLSEEKEKQLIEKYLDNQLLPEEIAYFKTEKEKNSDFYIRATQAKRMLSILKAEKKVVLKQELTGFLEEVKTEKTLNHQIVSKKMVYYLAAAISFILISTLTYLSISDNSVDNEQLYSNYYKIYETTGSQRGVDNESYNLVELYQAGSYQEVINLYEQTSKEDDRTELIYGNSLLQVGNLTKAEIVFRELTNTDKSFYREYGFWYLSLTLLKEGNTGASQELLNKIIKENMIHASEARELLDEMGAE